MLTTLTDRVRRYWEAEPCGTEAVIVGEHEPRSRPWFDAIERFRYENEPFIHGVAQFTRHRGDRVLEIGVGAGSDHLQWALAGADLWGVDLTEAAIETTRAHLQVHGLESRLQRVNAETLPFEDGYFDVVYSWGVIHHAERPEAVIGEVRRVLRPGGRFIGMLYHRRSLLVLRMWLRHGLRSGRPWRSLSDVVWHHMESVGTRAYTPGEVEELFAGFDAVSVSPLLTSYDRDRLPAGLVRWVPDRFGWFLAISAER